MSNALALRNATVSYAHAIGVKQASKLKREALNQAIARGVILNEVALSLVSDYVGTHRSAFYSTVDVAWN